MVYVDGWRGRIGLITPSPGSSTEAEFNRYRPEGVAILTTRIPLTGISVEALSRMNTYVDEAAMMLAGADTDVIVFGCTAGSLLHGFGYDREIIHRLKEMTGKMVTTTSTGVVEALKSLSAGRVAVATPYSAEVNDAEQKFLEGNGFAVTTIIGPLLTEPRLVPQIPPGQMYRLARQADSDEADVLFISCTGLHVLDIIEPLEKDLGKPVITSNQVSLWSALKKMNVDHKFPGLGRIFSI